MDFDLSHRIDESLRDGAEIVFFPHFLQRENATQLFDQLRSTLSFEQGVVTAFGRRVPQPRMTAWVAQPGCPYSYSGLTHQPTDWTEELLDLRAMLEAELDAVFNTVLVNLYRDGSDKVGWHADDEPCFVSARPIASLSLGATRRFLLRHRESREKKEYPLEAGSLLVMLGRTQEVYHHSVPSTRKPVGERINLTWRHYKV